MSIQRSLLALGYFPRELPIAFTTFDFGKHADDIIDQWEKADIFSRRSVKKKASNYTYKLWDTESELISKPKRGYERRSLHLTHPIPQALLAQEIGIFWSSIAKWLSKQEHSLDKIAISERYSRAIKGIDFRAHETKKEYIESTSDWLVRTDITRFYPTIYTHSIAWAAYGKINVKSDIKKYEGSLADRLDFLVRCCNRNQTIGIPIGPETSRILAEVISASIDHSLSKSIPNLQRHRFDRLQDDWFIGADHLNEAESVLSRLITVYREFGLEINGTKTSVQHILSRDKRTWRAELTSQIMASNALKGRRLRDLLRLALQLQASHPAEQVVSYVITVIEAVAFSDADIPFVESFLLEASILAPTALDRICHLLVNIHEGKSSISVQRVRDRFKVLCERHLDNSNVFEALWMLYTLRGLKVPIQSKRMAEQMEFHQGSVIPIVLLDMHQKSLFKSRLPIGKWEAQINKDQIRKDWTWLLAYEGIRHGWLRDKKNVMKEQFFNAMHSRGVVFYDEKKNVPRISTLHKRKQAAIRASIKTSQSLMASLRGVRLVNLPVSDDY